MTSSPTEATPRKTGDSETALNRLIDGGYRFIHPCDATGNLVAIVGVRAHHTVVDVVRIEDEHDVTATRMPADEPDILQPRSTLWRESGSVSAVVDKLFALPDDAYSDAVAGNPAGCWIPASPGQSKFLMAS